MNFHLNLFSCLFEVAGFYSSYSAIYHEVAVSEVLPKNGLEPFEIIQYSKMLFIIT